MLFHRFWTPYTDSVNTLINPIRAIKWFFVGMDNCFLLFEIISFKKSCKVRHSLWKRANQCCNAKETGSQPAYYQCSSFYLIFYFLFAFLVKFFNVIGTLGYSFWVYGDSQGLIEKCWNCECFNDLYSIQKKNVAFFTNSF